MIVILVENAGIFSDVGYNINTVSISSSRLYFGRYSDNIRSGVCFITDPLSLQKGLKCWGHTYGMYRLGSQTVSGDNLLTIGNYIPLINMQTEHFCTGHFHTCFINTIGEVRCFGYNGYGQLGTEDGADLLISDNLPCTLSNHI